MNDPRRVFDADQMVASARTMGAATAAFHAELVAGGVSEPIANQLTYAFVTTVLRLPPKTDPPQSARPQIPPPAP
jgi:hypothetical protein